MMIFVVVVVITLVVVLLLYCHGTSGGCFVVLTFVGVEMLLCVDAICAG